MAELQNNLPPGWESKFDRKSGKYYFLNHYTRTTTWDDPRILNKHHRVHHSPARQTEQIAMQELYHGSPELKRNYVYPSQTTPIPAFQIPDQYSPKAVPLQDLNSLSKNNLRSTRVQDSSLSISSTGNTEESVSKISAMFPTVSDTHIRLLLKKYHNREALVISALQVEKHPITTPGPFSTPPPTRNIHPSIHTHLQMTPPVGIRFASRGNSPILRPGSGNSYVTEANRNSPKPHSPKLKLRYMKSIFPQAEETVILDVLSSNDNNIQKTSEALKDMGFEKRESMKSLQHKLKKPEPELTNKEQLVQVNVIPKIKTSTEKAAVKSNIQTKYKNIPEQVITIALESVEYDEDRANQILQMMEHEESILTNASRPSSSKDDQVDNLSRVISSVPVSQSRQSLKSILKNDKSENSLKESGSFCRVIEEGNIEKLEYRSQNLTNTCGANRNMVKGANQELLLEDYVKWQGPQPVLHKGPQGLARGPDKSLRSTRAYHPRGPNPEIRKGPIFGLARGGLMSQLKDVVEESRVLTISPIRNLILRTFLVKICC